MIKSMTAYGRGEVEAPEQKWVVELRSVNHRFLELSLNLPKRLWGLEDRLRKLIKSRISRGRVEMQLTWETLGDKALNLRLDQGILKGVRAILEELKIAGDLSEPLRLDHFLRFSDLIIAKEGETQDLEEAWETISPGVAQALEALEGMRRAEGAALAADLAGHLEVIRREMERITARAGAIPQLWREKVTARLEELFQGACPVDETRLAQEVALMAERRDLAEELIRLDSHVAQFQQTLEVGEPVGRKQEFLLQEMLREINTIGAKAQDLTISQSVLEVKGVLERLREQVQNVE
jgi:uncharacterized protein (TIGR00255 family)